MGDRIATARARTPFIGESKAPHDVIDRLDRLTWDGGQDLDLMTPFAKPVDNLRARNLVASDQVGRVEICQREDFHAAAPRAWFMTSS
ncbi:MAG: hypothetical protein U0794_08580 [Isosphaeraceae bacterium]